ncbi:hypothetical protein TIFTF001_037731 [Ficus carica]|uniref:Uncharacterized protein n=1 Tax=Ficus carica TaxID=3494 RepID=A0AA88JCF2_FICCA|nr:hypothetical protein TIFTF001_037731 [Ficus carica]
MTTMFMLIKGNGCSHPEDSLTPPLQHCARSSVAHPDWALIGSEMKPILEEQPSSKCPVYYKMRVHRSVDLHNNSPLAPAEPYAFCTPEDLRSFACRSLNDTEKAANKAICSVNCVITDIQMKLQVYKGKINYYTGLLNGWEDKYKNEVHLRHQVELDLARERSNMFD